MITVRQVIEMAARLIGIEEAVDGYFTEENAEGEKAVNALLACLYLVETELASEYFSLKTEEECDSNGYIDFDALSRKPLRIVSVTAMDGKAAQATICPTGIRVKKGAYKISYQYLPEEKVVDDVLEFDPSVTTALIGYGVAAQYCLTAGLYEEAVVWDGKYKQAIVAAKPLTKAGAIRAREWN